MLLIRCLGWSTHRHWFGFRLLGIKRAGRWTLGITDGMCERCTQAFRAEVLSHRPQKVRTA